MLAAEPRKPFFQRLREGLARSSNQLSGQITALFTKRRLDEETLQEFEDVLIQADLGVETAMRITDRLSDGRFGKEISGDAVRAILADEVEKALDPSPSRSNSTCRSSRTSSSSSASTEPARRPRSASSRPSSCAAA